MAGAGCGSLALGGDAASALAAQLTGLVNPHITLVDWLGNGLAGLIASGEGGKVRVIASTGRIWEFWRQPSGSLQLMSRIWAGSAPGYADRMTVSSADLDDDGDADAFIGFEQGGIMFLRDPRLGPPSNVRAVGGADSVALTWSPDRQTRVRRYFVYRATSAEGTFNRLHEGLLDQTFYTDASVTGGQTYFYRVTAATLAYFPDSTVGALRASPMSEMVSAQVGPLDAGLFGWGGTRRGAEDQPGPCKGYSGGEVHGGGVRQLNVCLYRGKPGRRPDVGLVVLVCWHELLFAVSGWYLPNIWSP